MSAATDSSRVADTPAAPYRSDTGSLERLWIGLTAAAAGLSFVGGIVGLVAPSSVYGYETVALADAATAQDIVGVAVVAPLLLLLAAAATRGSLSSWLCCLGCLGFTIYNYAIYALSIHFGPLFLVWVAVWGLALFALVASLVALDASTIRARFGADRQRLTGWFLVTMALLFAVLWLTEIVTDLANGRGSTSAGDWNVPTNPVHVLDLVFFLPAVAITGILLLRGNWFGYATAPAQLVFLALTCLPILVTPFVATARAHPAEWTVMAPVGFIAIASLLLLWRFLREAHVPRT